MSKNDYNMSMKKLYFRFGVLFVTIFLFPVYVFSAGSKDRTALYNELIKSGSLDQIRRQILDDEKFVKTIDGVTADNILMQALAMERDPKIIQTLLRAGVKPTDVNSEGQTAVMYACAYGKTEDEIRAVITQGTITKSAVRRRLLAKDANGYTAVDYAYIMNNPTAPNAIRKYLTSEMIAMYEESLPNDDFDSLDDYFQGGVAAQVPTYEVPDYEESVYDDDSFDESPAQAVEMSPFDLLADSERNEQAARLRLSSTRAYLFDGVESYEDESVIVAPTDNLVYIPNANSFDDRGRSRLMKAAVDGDMTLVANLLFSGASIDDRDNEGWTALMYAARYQPDSRIVQSLLAAGADISIKNNYGLTALSLAATYSKNIDVISLLLSAYKTVNEDVVQAFIYSLTTPTGKPVPYQISVAELFLNKGVDVNTFWRGKTSLMYAASSSNSTAILSLLLARGARKDVYSSDGQTAFYYAQNNSSLPHDEVFWSLNNKD